MKKVGCGVGKEQQSERDGGGGSRQECWTSCGSVLRASESFWGALFLIRLFCRISECTRSCHASNCLLAGPLSLGLSDPWKVGEVALWAGATLFKYDLRRICLVSGVALVFTVAGRVCSAERRVWINTNAVVFLRPFFSLRLSGFCLLIPSGFVAVDFWFALFALGQSAVRSKSPCFFAKKMATVP